MRYLVDITYTIKNPASPLHNTIRVAHRSYEAADADTAQSEAVKNFTGSRNASVKVISAHTHWTYGATK
jgi:hypothetical protein